MITGTRLTCVSLGGPGRPFRRSPFAAAPLTFAAASVQSVTVALQAATALTFTLQAQEAVNV